MLDDRVLVSGRRTFAGFAMTMVALLAIISVAEPLHQAVACPLCTVQGLTFCEEIATKDVAVIAKLVKRPPKAAKGTDSSLTFDATKSTYEIVDVLKGGDVLGDKKTIEVLYFGDADVGSLALVFGLKPGPEWDRPIELAEGGRQYVLAAMKLPKEGPERLAFFQEHLEDSDPLLQTDAYQEFARVPFATIKEFKSGIKHDTIVSWIKDPKTPATRRRLYLIMLSICGTPDDVTMLEDMLTLKEKQPKVGLDAMIAAYLTLKGPSGVDLIENLFLKKKPEAEESDSYSDTWGAIMALRFHGQEEKIIPRERLLSAFHNLLDRPMLADSVISDFARWEDWSVMDRLVELFKQPADKSAFLRVPVINYLRTCPLPKAKEYLKELAEIDPKAMKQAEVFYQIPSEKPAESKEKTGPTPATSSGANIAPALDRCQSYVVPSQPSRRARVARRAR